VTAPEHLETTIAAIATPPGPGGIGIIRISGRRALTILQKLFKPRHLQSAAPDDLSFQSHRMYYGWIIAPESNEPIDEVLAVYMRAPYTYTTEDVVEIQCHGSYLVLQEILAQIFTAGARPASPGEFTKRAFLNGRIDLTRAEGVIELIEARTRPGLKLATAQLQGLLQQKITAIRDALINLKAVVEVAIDFPEEDAEIIDPASMQHTIALEAAEPLETMIASADQGKIFREGISVVILGRPNVGKSSLLNCLLKEDRALVTPVPGTTRDTIEECLNIKGMPVHIIDTAGIRDTDEIVEGMGIERARAKLAAADLVLMMLDASAPLTPADHQLYASIKKENTTGKRLLLLNKTDLKGHADFDNKVDAFGDDPLIRISAKTLAGIEELTETIFKMMTGGCGEWDPGSTAVPNLRQKDAMKKALSACNRVTAGLRNNLPPDLIAIELQAALDHLGDIVGDTTSEDVLDVIFERFCIGK
jgi:tRNA modification GTPase